MKRVTSRMLDNAIRAMCVNNCEPEDVERADILVARIVDDRDRLLSVLRSVAQYFDEADIDDLLKCGIGKPFIDKVNAAIDGGAK